MELSEIAFRKGDKMEKKLRGDRNQCRGCGEYFNSTRAFDKHRVGRYATETKPNTRRCLTPEEMTKKGMLQSEDGFWITKKKLQKLF